MWQAEPPGHPCSVPQQSPQNRSFHCTSDPTGLRHRSLGLLHRGQLTLFPLRASHGACHHCPCSPVATRSPHSLLAKRQPWHGVGRLLHLPVSQRIPRSGAGGHVGAEPAPGPTHPGAERSLERSLWVCRGGLAPLSIAPRALGVSLSPPPSPLVLAPGPARPQPPSLPPLTCALRPRLMKAQMGL